MIKLVLVFMLIELGSTEESFEKSLVQVIRDAGRTVEVHKVHTEDNYILTVFRIPSKLQTKRIAFLMHGLVCSAADFVIGGSGASLAYLLADNGYDVWLGNGRGNIFSQAHETLNTTSYDFWNFSFHEIGMYDVPAMIDYALNMFNATKLTYVGHSQGSTVVLILLSMRPEYNSKISTAYLMAPAVYFRFTSHLFKRFSSMANLLVDFSQTMRIYEIYPINQETRKMLSTFCDVNRETCKQCFMFIGGDSPYQHNEDLIPKVLQFAPASAGYRQLVHFAQLTNSIGRFRQYDHGRQKNLEMYNQPVPKPYSLHNVRTNLHFLYGSSDSIVNSKDVEFLMAKLKTVTIGITKINDFNHIDFIYGKEVQEKVNNVVLSAMKSCE